MHDVPEDRPRLQVEPRPLRRVEAGVRAAALVAEGGTIDTRTTIPTGNAATTILQMIVTLKLLFQDMLLHRTFYPVSKSIWQHARKTRAKQIDHLTMTIKVELGPRTEYIPNYATDHNDHPPRMRSHSQNQYQSSSSDYV